MLGPDGVPDFFTKLAIKEVLGVSWLDLPFVSREDWDTALVYIETRSEVQLQEESDKGDQAVREDNNQPGKINRW